MLTAEGHVRAVSNGMATVEVAAPSACGNCRARSACGSGHGRLMRVPVAPGVRPGDVLDLHMAEGEFTAGVLVGYLVPALALLAGALSLSTSGDGAAAAGGAVGLAAGLAFARRWSRRRTVDAPPPVSRCSPLDSSGEQP